MVLLLYLAACTPVHPRVTLAPGASLKGYEVFVVMPVTDGTGARFNLDVSDSLRQHLARRLRSHNLIAVTDASADTAAVAVVVTSKLVDFRGIPMWLQTPTRGTTACELRSELWDNRTGQRLGEIVAADLSEEGTPLFVLLQCAHDVADAIEQQLRR
jgi:hypothetical protein